MRHTASKCRDSGAASRLERLETNATGGFAMGAVRGLATRRYHSLPAAAFEHARRLAED